MATLIAVNGTQTTVLAQNGNYFEPAEVRTILGCQSLRKQYTVDTAPGHILMLDDMQELNQLPLNAVATAIFRFSYERSVFGPALMGTEHEFVNINA